MIPSLALHGAVSTCEMTAKDRYADYLRSDHWLALRSTVRQRTGLKCEACSADGETYGHEVHHLHYGKTGDWHDIEACDLVGLCQLCHAKAHQPENLSRVAALPVSTDLRKRALLAILAPRQPKQDISGPKLDYIRLAKRMGLSERIAKNLGIAKVYKLAGERGMSTASTIAHHRQQKRANRHTRRYDW